MRLTDQQHEAAFRAAMIAAENCVRATGIVRPSIQAVLGDGGAGPVVVLSCNDPMSVEVGMAATRSYAVDFIHQGAPAIVVMTSWQRPCGGLAVCVAYHRRGKVTFAFAPVEPVAGGSYYWVGCWRFEESRLPITGRAHLFAIAERKYAARN